MDSFLFQNSGVSMTHTFFKTLVLVVAACGSSSFAHAQELFSRPTIEAALGALTSGVENTPNPGIAASVAPVAATTINSAFDAVTAPIGTATPAPAKLALP